MDRINKMDKAINKFFKDFNPNSIYTYSDFLKLSEDKHNNTNVEKLDKKGKNYYEYRKINLYRIKRIEKTFKPNQELANLIGKIKKPQSWLFITEDWCGDSAQNLPYIVKYLEGNPFISIRVILRDNNLEAIDNYFIEGNPRSIPKVVVFDEDANELFIWGPRPKFAQDLVQQLKSEGFTKEEFNKELHLWYGRNKGKELERELINLLKNIDLQL